MENDILFVYYMRIAWAGIHPRYVHPYIVRMNQNVLMLAISICSDDCMMLLYMYVRQRFDSESLLFLVLFASWCWYQKSAHSMFAQGWVCPLNVFRLQQTNSTYAFVGHCTCLVQCISQCIVVMYMYVIWGHIFGVDRYDSSFFLQILLI